MLLRSYLSQIFCGLAAVFRSVKWTSGGKKILCLQKCFRLSAAHTLKPHWSHSRSHICFYLKKLKSTLELQASLSAVLNVGERWKKSLKMCQNETFFSHTAGLNGVGASTDDLLPCWILLCGCFECVFVCVCPFFQPSFLRKTHKIELWWDLLCAVDVSVCAFARPELRFAGAGASKCHGVSTCLIVHVSVWVVVHDSHGSAIPLITTAAWKGRLPFIAAVCDRKALSGWQTPPANLISSSFRWRIPGYEQLPKLFENIMEQ